MLSTLGPRAWHRHARLPAQLDAIRAAHLKLSPWTCGQVEDLVVAMDEALRPAAIAAAQRLRGAGRRVDLLLEPKKMKWVFKVRRARSIHAHFQCAPSVGAHAPEAGHSYANGGDNDMMAYRWLTGNDCNMHQVGRPY